MLAIVSSDFSNEDNSKIKYSIQLSILKINPIKIDLKAISC